MTAEAAVLLLLLAATPGETEAFEVVTRAGEVLPVRELAETPAGYLLRTPGGGRRLAPDSLDFHATFRRNLERGRAGNVLWFTSGRWMRFEKLSFEPGGRLHLQLGSERELHLPEAVVDFRATVLESGPTVLPRGRGRSFVARSTGPPPPERPSEPEPVDSPADTGGAAEDSVEESSEPAGRDLGRPGGGLPRRRLGDR